LRHLAGFLGGEQFGFVADRRGGGGKRLPVSGLLHVLRQRGQKGIHFPEAGHRHIPAHGSCPSEDSSSAIISSASRRPSSAGPETIRSVRSPNLIRMSLVIPSR